MPTLSRLVKYFAAIAIVGVMYIALAGVSARAAELVMFEQAGCVWCAAFDRDIPCGASTQTGPCRLTWPSYRTNG